MALAVVLIFVSGLLVGYALFVNRSGATGSEVPAAPPSAAKSTSAAKATPSTTAKTLSKSTSGILSKKAPAPPKAIATAAPTLMKRMQLAINGFFAKLFSRKTPPAAAKSTTQPQPPIANAAPKPEGASGEGSKREGMAGAEAASGAEASAPPEEYCLQLGAFTNLKLAQQLQATLKDKGYTTVIFEGVDVGYKRWHAVRMSKFPDVDSATKAAADFTAKEKLQAIVRPSGQL